MPQDKQAILHPESKIADTIHLSGSAVLPGLDTPSSVSKATRTQIAPIINRTQQKSVPAGNEAPMYIFFAILLIGIFARFRSNMRTGNIDNESAFGDGKKDKGYLTYYGDELDFSTETIVTVLNKRFPYYNTLTATEQKRFVVRLKNFISSKTFKIHDKSGYREMPILICATAIQLTFGLEKYMLPNFEFIHIHPREFIRMYPTIRVLEGTVSGRSMHISWKHFFERISKTG